VSKNTTTRKITDRIPRPKKKVTWPQARAFSVHLLNRFGLRMAFLSLVAAARAARDGECLGLGLALFVDGHRRGRSRAGWRSRKICRHGRAELLDNISRLCLLRADDRRSRALSFRFGER